MEFWQHTGAELISRGGVEKDAELARARGVSVFNTDSVCSFRFKLMASSEGESTALSSMKSPRWESSSPPMGVSSEIGSWAIFNILRTLSTGIYMRIAISSEV